ncbi:uncharacterized protein DUF937 [Salinibacterium amurskyense]|uniref:Uncharacterized protein DUF937 n=1 Tax=Salinibacterium amurskyense TaxID=205941 RepID=A0A2M9D2I3_9MICO|nr:DUF937 domain-containing protein [Salinibacterium amurskyense]PJJ78208.1 uncharacterized protein DUF937 [Salinibacterium amurskyense]RLQ80348.1 DUF937 domain-containing protein [Salinibacterium amurskyense]GHD82734.1 hypothetical protein GCM10007394_20200 [Salinibacterium amurskyense]
MSDLSGLLNLIPIGDIAAKLGVNEDLAEAAVKQVIPTLIGGMAANAKDDAGAKSLEGALSTHGTKVPRASTVDDIDVADGAKIVSNVFGGKQADVASAVADNNADANVTSDLIAKLLPIVAPIVISWVGSQFLGQKAAPAAAEPAKADAGGIGGLLGGLLGNAGGQDLVGGLIGGLLGGGKR